MKKLLLIHFIIALIVLIISGTGFFAPAIVAVLLIVAQRLFFHLEFIPTNPPTWYQILGICYASNFLIVLVKMIL